MKVEERKTISTAVRGAQAAPARAAQPTAAAAVGVVTDSASIMGIPEPELTPKVRAAIMALMGEVSKLRRELEQSKSRFQELERYANLDPLVPVLNRRAFVRELSRIVSFADRYSMTASLVYFDLNDFKTINDRHGHAAGDEVLLNVGRLLSANVRESDAVGRLGGDEFGVVLANASAEAAVRKAESLAALIERTPLHCDGGLVAISLAYGSYTFKPGEDPAEALARADQAMFKQKRERKNTGQPL